MAYKGKIHTASFDGGGAWCFSQLLMMRSVMDRIKWDKHRGEDAGEMLPSDYYDLIGGSDVGGLLVIMFVTLRMSVEAAIKALGPIVKEVYQKDLTPEGRSGKLRAHMEALLLKRGKPIDLKLENKQRRKKRCVGFILATSTMHTASKVCFRTYPIRGEPPSKVTVLDAALAGCASQPHFLPVPISVGSVYEQQDYISAALGVNNPVGKVLSEALLYFGETTTVISLLSLGSGYAGVPHYTPDGGIDTLSRLAIKMAFDSEQVAAENQERMGHCGIYFRFSVEQGMQRDHLCPEAMLGWISAQTKHYVDTNAKRVDDYVTCLTSRTTGVALHLLNHVSPTKAIYKEPPVLVVHYVRPQVPWYSIMQGLKGMHGRQTVIVISGMPGCGKTQLALDVYEEYNPKTNSHFEHVVFVDGTSEITVQSDLIDYVQSIKGPDRQIALKDAMAFFHQNTRWLLIYDGVDSDDQRPLLPAFNHGTIIITTRNGLLRKLASPGLKVDLVDMSETEAMKLILECADRTPSPENEAGAKRVAHKLWCQPLALTQAGYYMHDTGCSWDLYLEHISSQVMSFPQTSCGNKKNKSTYAALNVTYDQLPPHAQNFIHLASFFHSTHFPLSVVAYVAKLLLRDNPSLILTSNVDPDSPIQLLKETFFPDGAWSEDTVPSLTQVLQKYSLASITSTPATPLLHIHPLIHRWASDRLPPNRLHVFEKAACRFLVCCQEVKHLAQYLPLHIGAVFFGAASRHLSGEDHVALTKILYAARPPTVWLSMRNGLRNGVHPKFLDVVTTAVEFGRRLDCEALEAKDTPGFHQNSPLGHRRLEALEEMMSERSNTLSLQNKPEEALISQEEVLGKLKQANLRADNPALVKAVATLIKLRRRHQVSLERETVQGAILGGEEKQLGEAYLDTMSAMDRLAWAYYQQESLSNAESLQCKLLEVYRERVGETHWATLRAKSKLASTYQQQGRPTEAEPLQAQVLVYRTEALGETHPETLDAKCFLASTYCQLGRYDEARPLLEGLVAGWKRQLGEEHEDTLRAMNDLGSVYYELRQYGKSEELQLQVFNLCRTLAGRDSRAAATSANKLAWTYYQLDRISEADVYASIAEKLRKDLLGVEHQHYKATAKLIAILENRRRPNTSPILATPTIIVSVPSNTSPDPLPSLQGRQDMRSELSNVAPTSSFDAKWDGPCHFDALSTSTATTPTVSTISIRSASSPPSLQETEDTRCEIFNTTPKASFDRRRDKLLILGAAGLLLGPYLGFRVMISVTVTVAYCVLWLL